MDDSRVSMVRSTRRVTLTARRGPNAWRPLTVALVTYFFVLPLGILPTQLGRSVSSIMGVALVFVWVVDRLQSAGGFKPPQRLVLLLGCLAGWALITHFWSPIASASLAQSGSLVLDMVVFLVLLNSVAGLERRAVGALAIGAVALAAALTALGHASVAGRLSVEGVDQNITAYVLSIGFGAALMLFMTGSGKKAFGGLVLAGIIVIGIIATGSRTGLVAGVLVATASPVLVWGVVTRRRALARLAVLAGAFLIAFVAFRDSAATPTRLKVYLGTGFMLADPVRTAILNLYLGHISDWIIWGVGYASDAYYLRRKEGVFLNVHSFYFRTWVELGIVGLILFMLLLGAALVGGMRSARARPYLLILAPTFIFGYSLGGLQSVALFWASLAMVYSRILTYSPSSEGESLETGPRE